MRGSVPPRANRKAPGRNFPLSVDASECLLLDEPPTRFRKGERDAGRIVVERREDGIPLVLNGWGPGFCSGVSTGC